MRVACVMAISAVEAIIIPPITFMNAAEPGMKKKAAEDAIPSIGRSVIIRLCSWVRGSSGGVSSRTSSPDTVGGTVRGARLMTRPPLDRAA